MKDKNRDEVRCDRCRNARRQCLDCYSIEVAGRQLLPDCPRIEVGHDIARVRV